MDKINNHAKKNFFLIFQLVITEEKGILNSKSKRSCPSFFLKAWVK